MLLYVDEIDRRLPSFQNVPSDRIDRRERRGVARVHGREDRVAAVRAVEVRVVLQVDEPIAVARVGHVRRAEQVCYAGSTVAAGRHSFCLANARVHVLIFAFMRQLLNAADKVPAIC